MSRKPYDLSDFELWTEITQSVKPLHRASAKKRPPNAAGVPSRRPLHPPTPPPIAQPSRPAPPTLSKLDRRTTQKLQRGQADIDARIDLHGSSVDMARARLHDFLTRSRTTGARLVLVITGKGASSLTGHTLHGRESYDVPKREGKLRRLLPEWLAEAEFRHHVVGFQPAHPKHGGGGAFYVRLRRNRTTTS